MIFQNNAERRGKCPQKGERGQTFEAEGIADTGCGRMSCGPKVPEMYGYKIRKYEYMPLTTYTASGEPMKHLGQINCQMTKNFLLFEKWGSLCYSRIPPLTLLF